ncbi:MAG: hypothetical protein ACYTFY_18535 [Planctomycetota bacterium]|jgi:hypothetical protein
MTENNDSDNKPSEEEQPADLNARTVDDASLVMPDFNSLGQKKDDVDLNSATLAGSPDVDLNSATVAGTSDDDTDLNSATVRSPG